MSSPKRHSVIPPDEQRCVWMAAGILSYQLCDRMFECDDCPLDAAMRKHFGQREPVRSTVQVEEAAGGTLPEGLAYSRNHCWLRELGPRSLRIGLEPGLAHALLTPRAVVFPPAGQQLGMGQTCLWIVMEDGTLPLTAPAAGMIHATNRRLAEQPFLVCDQPFGDGWLLEMARDRGERDKSWMTAAEATAAYGADQARLQDLLARAIRTGRSEVGATLADGGMRLQSLADILGPSRYFSIVRKAFGP